MAVESENRQLNEAVLNAGIQRVFDEPALGTYWVVCDATSNIVASCMITIEWSDWNNAPYWWYQSVYIAPSWRGKGVFGELQTHIKAAAQQAGVCELRLYVETENARAIRAYEKCGFTGGHYGVMETVLS